MSHDNEYHTFEPGGAMVQWVKGLLIAGVIMAGVAFVSTWKQLDLLKRMQAAQREYADLDNQFLDPLQPAEQTIRRIAERDRVFDELDREATENDRRQMMIGIAGVVLYIVTAVLFLRSLSRANRNARALGATGLKFTPGWCIGWFFIPIANLFKPYQGVKEIWQASGPGNRLWETNPVSPVVGWWWFFWLVSGFVGQIDFRLTMRAETLPELINASVVSLYAEAAGVPAALVALLMIRKLYAMQESRYESQGFRDSETAHAPATTADWKSCRHCGEPVEQMFGPCPMCGEPLGATAADPDKMDNWRW